jgi:putative ABC transport system ATP-binding protein
MPVTLQSETADAGPPPIGAGVIFEVHGLTKNYELGGVTVHALRGIDLTLYHGEFTVLLGASGSGKSTLLNILGGLDTASSGTVRYFPGAGQHSSAPLDLGHATEAQLTAYRRHHVGFVFQFYNLIPSLTASENVAVVTEIARQPMLPNAALALVGLSARVDHFPAQLSGGEQQRVAIARAVAKNPAVLLCDEPTGALDSQTGIVVLEALLRVNETLGTSTTVITHNVTIAQMADRVIRLVDGQISDITVNQTRHAPAELTW